MFSRVMSSLLAGRGPLWLSLAALCLGAWALTVTPREEEPQIVVPMLTVTVAAPGLDAEQVSRQVVVPLEKLLAQIPGVEHVYASAEAGGASVLLRFFVGEDREAALVNTFTKLNAHVHEVPAAVTHWQLAPREVDDVPILVVGLWSQAPERYGPFELRQLAEELVTPLQSLPRTSEVKVQGGSARVLEIALSMEALAARATTALDVLRALQRSNQLQAAGTWTVNDQAIVLEGGDVFRDRGALEALVVNVIDGVPITLGEVAKLRDGAEVPRHYTTLHRREGKETSSAYPLVTLSVAKQRGANAVAVSEAALATLRDLEKTLFPDAVALTVLRDYGETANEKVNDLTLSLAFAVLTVVVFLGVFLGGRAALVVGLAVPVCYGLTLALDYSFGYTINRVTLFALILALGLLVDDPITGVDNISRYLKRGGDRRRRVIEAMAEIRSPLVLSTVMVILAFLPLAFITGMMGPYMAPMAFNVPVSVMASTLVAFLVTPWLSARLLPEAGAVGASASEAQEGSRAYRRLLAPLLQGGRGRWLLWGVLALFLLACLLPLFRAVPLKLLPFDNKNEVQVLIDLPEGASLERTAAVAERVAQEVLRVPEVAELALFAGVPSPVDFNGLVRRYDERHGPELAELRLVLVPKAQRAHQSHAVVLRLRALLAPLQGEGVVLRVVEVPPGPPVLSTLVAEITRDPLTPVATQRAAAKQLMARLRREAHVVEVDSTIPAPSPRLRFVVDKQKAALAGIATEDVAQTLALANGGVTAGALQVSHALHPIPLVLRMDEGERTPAGDFEALVVRGQLGGRQASSAEGLDAAPQPWVALGELGRFEDGRVDPVLHRKDLREVIYVTAELNGRTPGEVIADLEADRVPAGQPLPEAAPRPWAERSFLRSGGGDPWQLPSGTEARWAGEGELAITLDVFRDMGLGYLFALLAIYLVLRVQTASTALSLIIMSAIPLTVIGILPGFWAMNQLGERTVAGAPDPVLFTATAMIGMIALAGIVVRNSLILVEFITQARAAGASVQEAVLDAGAIRLRPVLLTAGTTLLGNLIITLDPVFNGLALAIIFGIVASTLFTLLVVPLVYWLVFKDDEGPAAGEGVTP